MQRTQQDSHHFEFQHNNRKQMDAKTTPRPRRCLFQQQSMHMAGHPHASAAQHARRAATPLSFTGVLPSNHSLPQHINHQHRAKVPSSVMVAVAIACCMLDAVAVACMRFVLEQKSTQGNTHTQHKHVSKTLNAGTHHTRRPLRQE
jgi:hypothetical protein